MWNDALAAETKKLVPPLADVSLKACTIKKWVKICKNTATATMFLIGGIKSVAAFEADNADVQKQVPSPPQMNNMRVLD